MNAATCESCHEYQYTWYGVTIRTPGSASHHGRQPGQDCISSGCHNRSYNQFSDAARIRPVLRSAINGGAARLLPEMPGAGSAAPVPGAPFDHRGVTIGQCQTCHNGNAARGLPVRHLVTRASCDACHRTTAWTPAQFSHTGVLPSQCQTCHNGAAAIGKSSGHFVTARFCDACHRTFAWVPVQYSHLSSLYRSQPDKPTCASCHITNGEIIPRQMRGGRASPADSRPARLVIATLHERPERRGPRGVRCRIARCGWSRWCQLVLVLLVVASGASARAEMFDDFTVRTEGTDVVLQARLNATVRYLRQTPAGRGALFRITFELIAANESVLTQTIDESRRLPSFPGRTGRYADVLGDARSGA